MAENGACWEVTGCGKQNECVANDKAGGKPCWEIVSSLDDYRSAMNVCGDCIVYVLKQRSELLSMAEIEEIMAVKGDCISNYTCPKFLAS